ncbi:MAG TPA: lipocalin family protein, partial [Tepidisphaeraceae bacterium]|nr:lipocalin family protein [Tepidisphaeraceae bacterium]
ALDLTTPLPNSSSPHPPTSARLTLQGPGGLNPKSAAPGNASYYYSLTRLPTTGAITLDATKHNVTGLSWMDREFSTSSLAPHQVGWDWIALHLRSGHDLMLYRIRNQANQTDYLSGTLVSPAGVPTYLTTADIALAPTATWTSPATKATYPSAWSIAVRGLPKFTIRTLIPDQELQTPNSTDVTYYEGAVSAKGDDGADLGEGYLEMTGYTKPITR